MTNEFFTELTKFKNLEQTLRSEIESELTEEKRSISSQPGSNEVIENLFEMLNHTLENLKRIHTTLLSSKSSSVMESVKRSSIIDELDSNYRRLKMYYMEHIHKDKPLLQRRLSQASTNDKYEMMLNLKDKRLSPDEVEEIVETQKKKQDTMITEFSSLIKQIHRANVEIEDELQHQKPVIFNLDNRVQDTKDRVTSTTEKLDFYLQKASNCQIFSFIAIEVLVIILLFCA